MEGLYSHKIVVPKSAIDIHQHVNNIEYLRWMQEIATAHSTARGWPWQRYINMGQSWVIRSNHIDYLRPALLGDEVTVLTWIAGFDRVTSPRRYLFWRERDGKVLARGETVWTFVDLQSGRPRAVPQAFMDSFTVIPDEKTVIDWLGKLRSAIV